MSVVRIIVAATGLVLTTLAAAAEHPAYKPTKVEGIATYKSRNEVGNWLFTPAFVEPSVKSPPPGMAALTFSKGSPPQEWWARSYFPCTLKEGAASIAGEYRKLLLATEVWIDGKNVTRFVMPVEKAHLGPTWNTVSFEGAQINGLLKSLKSGNHEVILWRQLEYELKTSDKASGKAVWKAGAISLAKGKLPVEVK
jgi:hypothetical protein